MAILDKKFEFMDAQAITGIPNAYVEGYTLDLGTAKDEFDNSITPDIGEAGELYLNVRIATAITGGTAANVATVQLHTAATAATSTGTVILYQPIPLATSAAGQSVVRAKVPAGTTSRYLGFGVLLGASTLSTGNLDAWIGLDTESELPSA